MKRKFYFIIVFGLILIVFAIYTIYSIMNNGFSFVGGGWQDSPQKALEYKKNNDPLIDDIETYEISELVDIIYFDNMAEIIYISKNNMFVACSVVTNEKGKWHFKGITEEDLSDPHYLVLNGEQNQEILFKHHISTDSLIAGWKYAEAPDILVNGKSTQMKNYKFTINNEEWLLDYWWIDDTEIDRNQIIVSYKEW